MYTSSDGTEKDVKTMNTEHLINALAKCLREIYNSKNVKEYNTFVNNIANVSNELYERQDAFLKKRLESEWK